MIHEVISSKKRRCCPRRPPTYIFCHPCVLMYEHTVVPLRSIKYQATINGGIANVNLIQEYENNNSMPINVTYKFPVSDKAVFSEIEAIFKQRLVKGVIKEKKQAKKEFNEHKARGNTVAYAEQLEETEDIMRVELGNFPAGETLKICFKYIVRLDVVDEALWSFIIPSTLTPRYNDPNAPSINTNNS